MSVFTLLPSCTSNTDPQGATTSDLMASGGDASGGESSGGDASGGESSGGDASGGSMSGGADGSGGSGEHEPKTYVYIGSGAFGGSEGRILIYEYDRATYSLIKIDKIESGGLASALVIDEEAGRLYAVDESRTGVRSFTIDKATGLLTDLGPTLGENSPVFLAFSPDKKYLLAANYNQGNVDVYPIGPDGLALASTQTIPTGMNAHSILIDEQNHVFVANKGADTISLFDFVDGALKPKTPATVSSPSPRHIFLQNDKAYVVSESADDITAFSVASDGTLTEDWNTTRLMDTDPISDTGAEIQITPSGKYLYASNRGTANTLVAYDISSGNPSYLEHESTQGETPRNFQIDPLEQAVLVANQDSNTVVVFAIGADGRLDYQTSTDVLYPPYFVAMARF